ncbi:hypothetical protein MTR_7g111330 [Medicago truncatula]|uniref:Uncharacterized protein n=1 Tax=Medicago truncatula TaxID=3880 RepID=G7KVK5_MEDTR|nr:hypothetical protein MTR_7g111330 [Medicago truncatula]
MLPFKRKLLLTVPSLLLSPKRNQHKEPLASCTAVAAFCATKIEFDRIKFEKVDLIKSELNLN